MTEKQKGAATLVLALIIALAWLSVRLYRGSGSLDRLTRIVSLQHWQLSTQPNDPVSALTSMPSAAPYLWLTRHELLHFSGGSAPGLKAAVYDTDTKQDQPAPGLSALQPSPQMVNLASPDGKWLLSSVPKELPMVVPKELRYNGSQYMEVLASLCAVRRADGKTLWYPDIPGGIPSFRWMPDSRHWMTDLGRGLALAASRKPPVPSAGPMRSLGGRPGYIAARPALRLAVVGIDPPSVRYISLTNMGSYKIIGAAAPDKVILSACDPTTYLNPPEGVVQPPLPFVEVSLASPQALARKFSVAFPQTPTGGSSAILLSPAGDNFLWICLSAQPSLINWRRSAPERKSADFSVFPTNGGSPRHLGTWSGSQIGNFQWNPDSRHISFSLENVLYSLPI